MKRRKLIQHLEAHGCLLKREGGEHTVYWNPETKITETVPRHSEIMFFTAKKICLRLGCPVPSER